MKIALITSSLIAHHAVPNSVIRKLAAIDKAGLEISLFPEKLAPDCLPEKYLNKTYSLNSNSLGKFYKGLAPFNEAIENWLDSDVHLFDYPHYYPMVDEINRVDGVKGFIYHGITPPAFSEKESKSFYTNSIKNVPALLEADFGIVYSPYTRNELITKYNFPEKKIFQIPFGINLKEFSKPRNNSLMETLGLKDKIVLTYVGRISPHKNIEFLVKGLKEATKKFPKLCLLIVGDDRGEYAKEKKRLIDLAKKLGVENIVKFTGLVENLSDYYGLSDIIVSASLHEGCWVPGLEAMAAGVPVLGSNTTAIPSTVGNAGLFFDPTDESDFIEKLSKLISDKTLRKKIIREAKKRHTEISIEEHDKQFIKILKKIKSKPPEIKKDHKITPGDLINNLKLLETTKEIRVNYYEFSARKNFGPLISKLRDLITRHIRLFYIKPLENSQSNFNNQVVKSYSMLLEYLSEKEKWKIKEKEHVSHKLDADFYNQEYFIGGGKSNYADYKNTQDILDKLAMMIYKTFKPRSLLDIGCAFGFVPIRLRELGVEAYGMDISEFAITEGNKPYLMVGSALDLSGFKKQVEVVFASELMEHIPENEINKCITEAKKIAKKYIVYLIALKGFASHDHDNDHDISHVTLKDRKFWLNIFKKFSLERDFEKEKMLNEDTFSVEMGWSGRFFVLKV